MLGKNNFSGMDREESLDSNSARRPESAASNNLENEDESSYLYRGDISSGINADYGQNSVDASSQAEINRLSSELNSRISREMDQVMNSVSVQLQRAIDEAISYQFLPQIQNAIENCCWGHMTKKVWNVSAERPETKSDVLWNMSTRENSRNEHVQNRQNGNQLNHNDYDRCSVY